MPILPDLFINKTTGLKMVGYLGERYEIGCPPYGFLKRLRLVESWAKTCLSPGHHTCSYCNQAKSNSEYFAEPYQWPKMLTHYIKKHNYLPPTEFINFIMKSKKSDFTYNSGDPIQLPEFDF